MVLHFRRVELARLAIKWLVLEELLSLGSLKLVYACNQRKKKEIASDGLVEAATTAIGELKQSAAKMGNAQ
jgi:hypothetical protein